MSYPQERQGFTDLLLTTFKKYPKSFVTLLPFALLLGVTSCLYFYVSYLPDMHWVKLIATFIVVLIQVYLWAASLIAVNHYFAGSRSRVSEVCHDAWVRLGSIYAGFFLSILILCATFFIGYYIVKAISWISPANHQLYAILVFVFISLPLLGMAVWLMLLVPQLSLMKKNVGAAFKDSFKWVGFNNFIVTFILYVYLLLLMFLVYPDAHHMHWMRDHFLALPFNVLVYMVFLPFLINYILLLLNRVQKLKTK